MDLVHYSDGYCNRIECKLSNDFNEKIASVTLLLDTLRYKIAKAENGETRLVWSQTLVDIVS